MKDWKQPITSECLEWSALERVIFFELMIRTRNEAGLVKPFWHGNKFYQGVELERGQSIFSISRFADETGIPEKRIRNAIKRLINRQIIMTINRKSFGIVVSIKNYDDLVKMDDQSADQSADRRAIKGRTSNKSVKSVKIIDKSIRRTPSSNGSYGNQAVKLILSEFKELTGYPPTDPKPNYVAYVLVRQITGLLKVKGVEATDENIATGIKEYFHWLGNQEFSDKIERLDAARRKFIRFKEDI